MRGFVVTTLAAVALCGLTDAAAAQSAYDYPWCALRDSRGGGQSCYFATHAQCVESLVGIGGTCIRNPGYRGPARYDRRRPHYSDY